MLTTKLKNRYHQFSKLWEVREDTWGNHKHELVDVYKELAEILVLEEVEDWKGVIRVH